MRRLMPLTIILFLLITSSNGQTGGWISSDEVSIKKLELLADLQALNAKVVKLDGPLARALAKAEIADAAWTLDQDWAKKLLKEAYGLTFPTEEERSRLRNVAIGAAPVLPNATDRARNEVRNRIFSIAGRDRAFANQLAQLGADELGRSEQQFRYARLATDALSNGENEAASRYILQAMEADPTQLLGTSVILDVALRDRAEADRLIIQYIKLLRATPLSMANQSALRTYFILGGLVFPSRSTHPLSGQIKPAGPDVIREYASFLIESIGRLEQNEPGSAQRFRGFLLSAWLPINQYAPELIGRFMELERLSRRPGQDAALPRTSPEETSRASYESRIREALNSDQPDELTINFAISREDFSVARKLIGKLQDGAQKTELLETVNAREAMSLATKGDIAGAERLAEQLGRATSILQVYPVIINKCVAKRDQSCVTASVYQAMKQLKRANTELIAPPAGIPASVVPGSREFDPVSLSLSRLAKAVAPVNETLALEVLEEMVRAANRSNVDMGQGRIGFDVDVFKKLAPTDEARVRQDAAALNDPLRQIIALAAIYQWKAEELVKQTKPSQ